MINNIIDSIRIEFLSLIKMSENGYFISLEKTYTWLENKEVYDNYAQSENFRRNFKKRFLRSDKFLLIEADNELDLDKDFLMIKNDNNISFPWFSIEGFKIFCMVVTEPKASFVRKYFIQIEKDYMRVLEQTTKQNEQELNKLNMDISNSKSSLLRISNRCEDYLEENLVVKHMLKTVENLSLILDDNNDFSTTGNNEYKLLMYLQQLHMKKISLYIVNNDYIKPTIKVSKDNKNNNPDIIEPSFIIELENETKPSLLETQQLKQFKNKNYNNDQHYYEKNYDEYNFNNDINIGANSGDISPILYYYISAFDEKIPKNANDYYKICDLYIKDKQHLNSIREYFETDDIFCGKYIYKTSKKWIYKTSYTEIKNVCLNIMQDRYCALLLNQRNNK